MPKHPRSSFPREIEEDGNIDGTKKCVNCGEFSAKLLFLDKMLKPTETDLFCRLEGSIESLMRSAEYRTPAGKQKLAELQYKKIDQWLHNLQIQYQRTLDKEDVESLRAQVRRLIRYQAATHDKSRGVVVTDPLPPMAKLLEDNSPPSPGAEASDKALPPLQRRPYRNRVGKQRPRSKTNSVQCTNCSGWVTPVEMRGKNEGKLPIKKCIDCRTSRFIWQKVRQQRGNLGISSGKLMETVMLQAMDSIDTWEKGLRGKTAPPSDDVMRWLKNGIAEEVANRIERETGNGNFIESPHSSREPDDSPMDTTVSSTAAGGNDTTMAGGDTESEPDTDVQTATNGRASYALSDEELSDPADSVDVDMMAADAEETKKEPTPPPPPAASRKIRLNLEPKAKSKNEEPKSMAPASTKDLSAKGAAKPAVKPAVQDHSPASWATSMVRLTKELRNAQMDLSTAEFSTLIGKMRRADYQDPDAVIALIEAATKAR